MIKIFTLEVLLYSNEILLKEGNVGFNIRGMRMKFKFFTLRHTFVFVNK
jgi:hypothetical protein